MFVQDKPSRHQTVRRWLKADPVGKVGLARLEALGASWRPRGRTDEIVEAVAKLDGAPRLPPVNTARDRVCFLAGVLWVLAWIAGKAQAGNPPHR